MEKRVVTVFDAIQNARKPEEKGLAAVLEVYQEAAEDRDEFVAAMARAVLPAFEVGVKSLAVDRVLSLYASFVCHCLAKDDLYVNSFVELLTEYYDDARKTYRLRACELVLKLMQRIANNDLNLREDVFQALRKLLLKRSRDKFPAVRVMAVKSLAFFQTHIDPDESTSSDEVVNLDDDPVVKAFDYILTVDQNAEVRRAVLENMWINCQTLFKKLLRHCRDVSPICRAVAFSAVGEHVSLMSLTLSQRIDLLIIGFQNTNNAVLEAHTKLIKCWLQQCEGNASDLLALLDVVTETETCSKVMNAIFRLAPPDKIKQSFDILNDKNLMEDDLCTPENVFQWACIMRYFKERKQTDLLEDMSPTAVDFAHYLTHHFARISATDNEDDLISRTFVAQQLLAIALTLDLSMDEKGRKALISAVGANLRDSSCGDFSELVKPELELLLELTGKQEFVSTTIQIISDLRMPLEEPSAAAGDISHISEVVEDNTESGTQPLDPVERERLEHELAKVRVQVMEQRDKMDSFVDHQDFISAAEEKKVLSEIEAERDRLQALLAPPKVANPKPDSKEADDSPGERKDSKGGEIAEKTDPITIFKCLTIAHRIPQMVFFKTLPPVLNGLRDQFFVAHFISPYDYVRNKGAQCIGVYAMFDRHYAVSMLPLIVQMVLVEKKEALQMTALRIILDLVLRYGLSVVDEDNLVDTDGNASVNLSALNDTFLNHTQIDTLTDSEGEESSPASVKLIRLLVRYLDNVSCEMRTVAAEGLAKLLLHDRITSADIFCRLCLLWFSPVSRDESYLRQCLGQFFPFFALSSKDHQLTILRSFLPILKTIFKAPLTSPLASIDCEVLIKYLCALTSPHNSQLLQTNMADPNVVQEAGVHEKLSVMLCEEILSSPFAPSVPVLAKALTYIQVDVKSPEQLNKFVELLQSIEEEIDSQAVLKVVSKVKARVTGVQADLTHSTNATASEAGGGGDGEGGNETRDTIFNVNTSGVSSVQNVSAGFLNQSNAPNATKPLGSVAEAGEEAPTPVTRRVTRRSSAAAAAAAEESSQAAGSAGDSSQDNADTSPDSDASLKKKKKAKVDKKAKVEKKVKPAKKLDLDQSTDDSAKENVSTDSDDSVKQKKKKAKVANESPVSTRPRRAARDKKAVNV